MNLFTDPIHKIKFEDIQKFCEESIPEGIKVDYKQDFPNNEKLAKVISSFANTRGGIILIGVEEKNRIPIVPIKGIINKGGYEEKITGICMRSINPPIMLDVHEVSLNNAREKCVVVIRVDESDETPHRVKNDTEIYIRINSISEPLQKAPWEEVEWLMNRRKKAVENKKFLLSRAENRFENQKSNYQFYSLTDRGFRGIYLIPFFPSEKIINIENMESLVKQSRLNINGNTFPLSSNNVISSNESIIYDYYDVSLTHTEINQFGLIWHKESFGELDNGSQIKIDMFSVLKQLIIVSLFGLELYKNIGFYGVLEIHFYMQNIINRPLEIIHNTYGFKGVKGFGCSTLDSEFSTSKAINIHYLQDHFKELMIHFYKNFLWSCGAKDLALNQKALDDHFEIVKNELNLL